MEIHETSEKQKEIHVKYNNTVQTNFIIIIYIYIKRVEKENK